MIEIRHLEKSFGRLRVLKRLDLQVTPGRVTAVLGHNGSGKTTLIKILLGLVRPDGGEVMIDGQVLNGEARFRERIGYMPQSAAFPGNLTAREVLAMLKDLRGNPARVEDELIAAFALGPEMDKPLRTLSGGTRQKVSAAVAFLFDPALLILDEPTAGLDPIASSTLKDKIRQERARGKTIILTSHVMSEVEELADDVAFLLDGEVRFCGEKKAIIAQTAEGNLERAIARMMLGGEVLHKAA